MLRSSQATVARKEDNTSLVPENIQQFSLPISLLDEHHIDNRQMNMMRIRILKENA